MDASDMSFPDNSFDVVVAMFVMTVVPEPAKVMRELERVCRQSGQVIVVNHFSAEGGVRGLVEKTMAPFAASLGWRPEFPVERLLGREALTLTEQRPLQPLGLFTMLRFVKDDPTMPPAARDMVRQAGEPRPIEGGVREDPAY
jgi:phosphatidylethanolamine/phosphatidyl-N-methylethanolamine N-methyltransferase